MKNIIRNKYLYIMAFALISLAGALYALPGTAEDQAPRTAFHTRTTGATPYATADIAIRTDDEDLYFNVELALTPQQQSQGLMYRTDMPPNAGMLFLFDSVSMQSFWMKNTLIPLDILFLHPNGVIHHIHHNAKPQDLTSITSKYPSKAVLELNGGTADQMGIDEGDMVIHDLFNNTNL